MKTLIIGLILVTLLLSISCAKEDTESGVIEEEQTLTEEQEKQWSEKGSITVSTLAEASRLAGYPVATPSFIPESFDYGQIIVGQLGGLPAELGGEWGDGIRHVDQMWRWPDYPSASLMLIQIPEAEREGSGEPIDICGRRGWRQLHEANGHSHPLLELNWYENGMLYSLAGILAEPLTEEIVLQIACSVEAGEK